MQNGIFERRKLTIDKRRILYIIYIVQIYKKFQKRGYDVMKKAKAAGSALLYFAIYYAVQFAVSFVFALVALFDVLASSPPVDFAKDGVKALVDRLLVFAAPITLIANLLFVGVVLLVFVIRKKNALVEVGLLKPKVKNIFPSIFMGASLNIITNVIFSSIKFPQTWVDAYEKSVSMISGETSVITILTAVISAPLAEEILFRGLIHTRISRGFGLYVGAAVSSLLFGLVHGNMIQGIYAAILGLVLVWVFIKTRSLICPMLLHFSFNGINYIVNDIGLPVLIISVAVLASCVAMIFVFNKKEKAPAVESIDVGADEGTSQ